MSTTIPVTVPTRTTTEATDASKDVVTVRTATSRLLRSGLVAGAVAAAATSLMAALSRAAGVDLAVAGERIPLAGFAMFTIVGALIGIALAKALSRWARHPRSTFVRTTVALTVVSVVPDVFADTTVASKLVLAATHIVAGAIIIPVLARRLAA